MNASTPPLVLRLSSLGDLVLATAALQAPDAKDGVDWVVSSELATILEGHPRIRRLIRFDRSAGLAGWHQLCLELWRDGYSEVIDLHRTTRTGLARRWFSRWAREEGRRLAWSVVEKHRMQLAGYYLLKRAWPASLLPPPWIRRYAEMLGANGLERPDCTHLLDGAPPRGIPAAPYVCVMPSSATRGREWPVARHADVLRRLPRGVRAVVLGTVRDPKSLELVEVLRGSKIDCVDGVGLWNLRQVAHVLAGAEALLGCDTGLAHLAEAVGTPVVVVRGPTTRGVGFGPWRAESKSIESSLWCSPCSKDGSFCFRPTRQRCLRDLDTNVVFSALEGLVSRPRARPLSLPSISANSR